MLTKAHRGRGEGEGGLDGDLQCRMSNLRHGYVVS